MIAYDVDRGETHRIELGLDVGWYIRALDGAGGVVVDGGRVVAVAHNRVKLLLTDARAIFPRRRPRDTMAVPVTRAPEFGN